MIRCLASRLIKSQLPTRSNLIVPLTKCCYHCQWTNIAVCAQLIHNNIKKNVHCCLPWLPFSLRFISQTLLFWRSWRLRRLSSWTLIWETDFTPTPSTSPNRCVFLKKKMMKGKPHNSSQLPPSLFVLGVRLTNIEDAAEVSSNLRYKQQNFLVNQTILFMLWNSVFVLCCCCGSMWKRSVPLRAEVAHRQLSLLLSLFVW